MHNLIAPTLLAWYSEHGRELPWRATRDPYRIWLSEIILQQTRVDQGLNYYLRFVEQWPTVAELAAASEDAVLKGWQGLGYYSRARNLHAAARQIMNDFGGRFPTTYEAIRSLRGVGDYTAAAIASMAFDLPHAVVDGNVYRVLARLFDLATPIDSGEGRKAFAHLAQSLLDPHHAAAYNQAIMDFGAIHCTPQHPACATCPLADRCLALAEQTVNERPVKQGRTRIRNRYFHYLHLSDGDRTLLHRRTAGDIWQGLYEFPLIEHHEPLTVSALVATPTFQTLIGTTPFQLVEERRLPPHQLSHQRIHACFYRIAVDRLPVADDLVAVKQEAIGDYAIARLTERYLELDR